MVFYSSSAFGNVEITLCRNDTLRITNYISSLTGKGNAMVVISAGMIDFIPYRWRSHEPLHCCGFRDEKQASLRGNEHKTVQRTEKKPLFQQRRSLSD